MASSDPDPLPARRNPFSGQGDTLNNLFKNLVIWLVIGNTTTGDILQLLLRHSTAIGSFLHEEATSLLTLRKA